MKKVSIDCYGNRNDLDPQKFNSTLGKKFPHLIDEQETAVYIAFAPASIVAQPIHKVVQSGTVTTITWAYGAWSDRESLTYDLTRNETRTVTVEE